MHRTSALIVTSTLVVLVAAPATAQRGGSAPDTAYDPIKDMVGRLDLEKYKATIKGLTQFGDRRQGTDRNRDAVDWIEAQLKSYGCTNTERITYKYSCRRRRATAVGSGRARPPPRQRERRGRDAACRRAADDCAASARARA